MESRLTEHIVKIYSRLMGKLNCFCLVLIDQFVVVIVIVMIVVVVVTGYALETDEADLRK